MGFDWQILSEPAVAGALAQVAEEGGLPISPLRIAGIVCGAIFLGFIVWQGSKRTAPRLNSLLGVLVALALVVISISPGIVTAIFGPFSLGEGEGFPRLIGLLMVAVVFIGFYQFLLTSSIERGRRDLIALVRTLAVDRYLTEVTSRPAPDVLLVIAAYNEEGALPGVLDEIPSQVHGLNLDCVVVVDGATDNTEAVARRFGVPAVHAINCGQPVALATGYEIAKRRGAAIVATMDADGQMVPNELERVIAPISDGTLDLVSGSRVLGSYHVDNRARGLGVFLFGLLVSVLIRQRITDTSNGMRAIRVSSLERMRFQEERFGGAAELLVEAYRRGLRIREVPVTIRPRTAGESRKPASLRYGLGYGWALIRSWLR